jgi:hypothetical protein
MKPIQRDRCCGVFPSVVLPMFLAAGGQTIVATGLPSIASGLGD